MSDRKHKVWETERKNERLIFFGAAQQRKKEGILWYGRFTQVFQV